MYSEVNKIFLELIKTELDGSELSTEIKQAILPQTLLQLYFLAKKHDMTHIVALALKKQHLLGEDELSKKFRKSLHMAVFRYEKLRQEQENIYKVFEEAGIIYVPLKGAVIRQYYAESWMRTSGDIDILVKDGQKEFAKDILMDKLGYEFVNYNYHDIGMDSPSKQHLELHFSILENEEKMDKMLSKVWEYVHPAQENSFRYEMEPEYFLFHVIAHMMHHFLHGGCGVRFVTDIWVLEKNIVYDKEKLELLCEAYDMRVFKEYAEKLTRVWFDGEAHDELSMQMQEYILHGGLYGNARTRMTAEKTRTKGRLHYMLQRVFVPFDYFSEMYPILKKYPILYPVYVLKRFAKLMDVKTRERAKQEMKMNHEIAENSVDEIKEMFHQLQI